MQTPRVYVISHIMLIDDHYLLDPCPMLSVIYARSQSCIVMQVSSPQRRIRSISLAKLCKPLYDSISPLSSTQLDPWSCNDDRPRLLVHVPPVFRCSAVIMHLLIATSGYIRASILRAVRVIDSVDRNTIGAFDTCI